MKLADAKKLHNGDEVIHKVTGESIQVLSTSFINGNKQTRSLIMIEGIGTEQGYRTWFHDDVK